MNLAAASVSRSGIAPKAFDPPGTYTARWSSIAMHHAGGRMRINRYPDAHVQV